MNGVYNEQLQSCSAIVSYNCRLSDLRLKLRNSGERKCKYWNCSLVPSLVAKNSFYSYLVENSQKAPLNFLFKSRFSVKPSKFPIYFAHDCISHRLYFFCNMTHTYWIFHILQFLLRTFKRKWRNIWEKRKYLPRCTRIACQKRL